MRIGPRMAVDVGRARLGIAICDRDAILSSPLEAIKRSSEISQTVSDLVDLARQHEVIEIYVGDPLSLRGVDTESTHDARLIALELSNCLTIPIRMIDERFTTVSAANKLRAAGINSKDARSIIDSVSAVEILENAINTEKISGMAPGHMVGDSIGT